MTCTDDQRRTEHRPTTLDELRAEAQRLTALGLRPQDIGRAMNLNDDAVLALLHAEPL